MNLPRFTVRRLMIVVAVAGVELASAMAGAFTFAVVTLSATTLVALLTRGTGRAFFLGFSTFGWAAMLLAFGTGPEIRFSLPTIRPIIRAYETIYGPGPTTFNSSDEAQRYIEQLAGTVNRVITVGHSLISLALALAGGASFWLIATAWRAWGGGTSVAPVPSEPK